MMEEISTDVLVIGGGLAGVLSALEAEKTGLKVLVLGKFAIGLGTNSSLATQFTAANSHFSQEDHFQATVKAGKGLCNVNLVKGLAENGPAAIAALKGYGVPVIEKGIGYTIALPKHSAQLPGVLLMKGLVERLRGSSAQLLPGFTVFDLVVEERRIHGAFGFFKDGKPCLIRSKATVLAAGGAGAIYQRNDNQRSILGDGYTLALQAGLPIYDLEFVQYYPFVLAEPRLSSFLLHAESKEGRLINERGKDLFEELGIKKNIRRARMAERDRLSLFLYEASQKGDVFYDLTQVPGEAWDRFPLNFLRKSKFPFRERPFLISPAVHFFMGGVEADEKGATGIPGLFAAGEVVWGLHGANRHGGNALTECAVFGIMAGRSAAEYACEREIQEKQVMAPDPLTQKWERKANRYLRKRRGVFDHPTDLLKELKRLAWKYAGPVREEKLLKEGLDHLVSLGKRIEQVYPATSRELFRKKELENVSLLVRAILEGSLLRTESRGSFYRKDFPQPDDSNWLKHSCYRLEKGQLKITCLSTRPPPSIHG